MSSKTLSKTVLVEYVGESEEIVRRVSDVLSQLEKGAQIADHIDALYRDIHTLKGTSQLFGFTEIGQLAHAIEASLGPIRKHKTPLSSKLFDSIYACLDLIENLIKNISQGSNDTSAYQQEFQSKYSGLLEAASQQFGGEFFTLHENLVLNENRESHSVSSLKPIQLDVAVLKQEKQNMQVKDAGSQDSQQTVESDKKTISEVPPQASTEIHQETSRESKESRESKDSQSSTLDTTIRVQVELLDRLMNLTGELVLVRNQVLQHANKNEDFEFLNLSQSLDLVTSDLQGEIMKTRMQPIGNVVSKFQRLVRDLARDLGKQIDLTLQGSETELDKTLLEAIKDPLTHLVRNSCDHGIETIEERKKVGKPETGHVLIRSFHEGGQVVVEISDDGRGLSRDKIVAKAIEKGLLTQEKASKLPEREVFNLIFLPGFSTAQQVSAVSGRGVGMDVVRTNIEKIGGAVDLSSRLGKGTTIKLKIPLTLAIVPALIVRSKLERFAIPQVKLVELVRVGGKEGSDKIEYLQKMPMYRLRGSLLPLVNLGEVLGFTNSENQKQSPSDEGTNIVVLNAEGENFGLVVDEILDTTDIVVKPLSHFLKSLNIFSGATIMGDGTVSLILDVSGLAQKAHLSTNSQKKEDGFSDIAAAKQKVNPDAQEFLLFNLLNQSVHAIPLCLVHRLEEFKLDQIESSGEQQVVQYRQSILPLIDLSLTLKYTDKNKVTEKSKKDTCNVIVIQRTGRYFGVVVNEILDVVTIDSPIDDSIRDRDGVLGNLLYDEEVVVVVDALRIIEIEMSRLGRKDQPQSRGESAHSSTQESLLEIEKIRKEQNRKIRILFAEDVAFFRRQVTRVLTQVGYEVITAEHGAKALDLLEKSKEGEVTLVISDIEMPEMNGLELARAIRKQVRFKNIPLIALTTRFKDTDVKAGREAGFDLYLEKLNEEKLLKSVELLLGEQTKTNMGLHLVS